LTNGKSFSDFNFTKKFVAERPKNFLTCVSLHDSVDEVHDYIVGSRGSFYKTLLGLYNLAKFGERIEVRVVVNKINAAHLELIAGFIYRNFPFIFHCAFMGLEMTGCAADNCDEIWIDPYEYRNELSKAIRMLSRAGINVSVYNLPLCLLNDDCWVFARKSISAWKNNYLPLCVQCSVKDICCGVFSTSGDLLSKHISPM